MQNKFTLLLVFAWLFPFLINGQDFNNYKRIRAEGQVPKKFTQSSTEKYNQELEKIDQKEKRRDKNLKKEILPGN